MFYRIAILIYVLTVSYVVKNIKKTDILSCYMSLFFLICKRVL